MSSLDRTLEADVLVHHLTRDTWMIDAELLARHGRSGRTLVKEGPLRLTIMALAAGGVLPAHHAEGPVTIHVVEGEIVVVALDTEYPLRGGDVLALAPSVEHSARSATGGVFLLTIVQPSTDTALP